MTNPAAVTQLKSLYKAHLGAANKFAAYNFRQYFVRWTQTRFQEFEQRQKAIASADEKAKTESEFVAYMQRELEARRRQALMNSMFQVDRLVVEEQI
ncbi:hypothetical protein SYNPS1DRAFT_15382 [Syncephalis pseudoplumigaleata]|uniref:Complex 1 LYR protein domain-containing protein n=1 Tax=Syncephalis pseudoplumigaleata TaxID=1712513 RepID=A0A4P9Z1L9_9FUNG|nr:hypothetical protein SYNPS1DRAFT_15382 [Syncephalis pseudoplumigaleata]|eukprot:RKP25641.1 hypothetical protein SYNPS1DRAFT_15382 [Syncephalis pseudoplumigaleata]